MMITKEAIYQKIKRNQTEEALRLSEIYANQQRNRQLKKKVLLLQAQWEKHDIKLIDKTITMEEAEVFENRFRQKLVEVINSKSQYKFIYFLIGIIVLFIIGISVSQSSSEQISVQNKHVLKGIIKNDKQELVSNLKGNLHFQNDSVSFFTNENGYFEIETDEKLSTIQIDIQDESYQKYKQSVRIDTDTLVLILNSVLTVHNPIINPKKKRFKTN